MSTTQYYPDGTGLTFEKVWAMFQEDREQMQESRERAEKEKQELDKMIKESQLRIEQSLAKLDARIAKTHKEIGNISNRMENVIEHMIAIGVKRHFNALGFHLRFPLITHSFAFVYDGVGQHSASWFYETYRKRFGIESSYRQSHACRIRTSTRSALLRLLYFALNMFLRNLWVTFEREVIFAGGVGKQKTSAYYGF